MTIKNFRNIPRIVFFPSILIITFIFSQSFPAFAGHDILIKYITEYNRQEIKKILDEGSYRGEAGIMLIKPEAAQSLGLKVYMDDDYRASGALYNQAQKNLDQAMAALRSKKKNENELASRIVDHFLLYQEQKEAAGLKMEAYRSRLKPGLDERFNDDLCRRKMEELLNKSLEQTETRLRDALALFYNICHEDISGKNHLTIDNVRFVNFVYRNFLEQAAPEERNRFDLDLQSDPEGSAAGKWKEVAAGECPKYIRIFERIIPRYREEIYEIDPLLFMALIKRESNFNPLAISSVGAAGLTQIMPGTAVDLGMKDIHRPAYYRQAGKLLRQEREAREAAEAAIYSINEENGLKVAGQARDLMRTSRSLGERRERLYTRYKVDLLRSASDPRLDPEQALEQGLKYFLRQMKARNGDISLALASYNAGPHRVKQYQGIPPFDETVHFRNMVLGYYREYTRIAREKSKPVSSARTD